MIKKIIHGFLESELIKIESKNIKEASYKLGEAMKEENKLLLEKYLKGMDNGQKERVIQFAIIKLDQLKEWSENDIFLIGNENRLKKYLDGFEGYCRGSELSEEEGAFLQIEVKPECQTVFVQKENGEIGFIHSEEEGNNAFDENHYGYKWVEMNLPNKEVSFFAYPGLCSWGPAFGINETSGTVQTVDDLYIGDNFDSGALWATAMSFITLDIGNIDLVKELVGRLNNIEGNKFAGGYAIHMASVAEVPEMISVEFAQDQIQITEPVKSGSRWIMAQANCPLSKEISPYSIASFPKGDQLWSEDDAELFVEMRNRQERLMKIGQEEDFPALTTEKTIDTGLKILANPWGDVGRVMDKNTGTYRYYPSGLPSNVMNSHFVGNIDSAGITYYVGKLTPPPIEGREFETKITPEYRFGLKKIWEEAGIERDKFNRERLIRKHPWLFLDRKYNIDIIYDFVGEEENERELSAGQDTVNTANELVHALETLSHKVSLNAIKRETLDKHLDDLSGEVVFNQVEEDVLGYEVLKYLEMRNKIVTGVGSEGFRLSWDKVWVKEQLVKSEVPTPKYFVATPEKQANTHEVEFPLFVKAADDHGSLSITDSSLVKNLQELDKQVKWVKEEIGGPALVEEYIDGRELGVTVIGNGEKMLILPIKEILFGDEFGGRPKVVTYKAKWDVSSVDYSGTTKMSCPAVLTEQEGRAIEDAVRKSCKALMVRDYARFDIRLKDGVPYVIDYNANPAIGSRDASGLPAKVFGLSYPEFIQAIVAVALKR